MYFFTEGYTYEIITPRNPDNSAKPYLEAGTKVVCIKVEPPFSKRPNDFPRDRLAGEFADINTGFSQTLYTGDVKKCA